MAWSGGTFTRVGGSTEWQDDAANGVDIEGNLMDTAFNDLATDGINQCLNKTGQNSPTANLPMGGFKHTGVANGSAATDYMAYGQIRNGTPLFMDTVNNRLGINTSTPSAALDVVGSGKISSNLGVNTAPGALAQIAAESTTLTYAAMMARVNVALDQSTVALKVRKLSNTNDSTQYFVQFEVNDGTPCGRIVGAGAGAAQFASSSDVRLKENIVDLPSQIAAIKALRPVEFDYKDGSGHQIGFVAQDVEQVYPDLVSTDPATGMKNLGGLAKNEARLIKVIQELIARVEALEAK